MRAQKDRSQFRLAAFATSSDDVARGVDRSIQFRRTHQPHNVLTSLPIRFAISNATDAALRILAELREFLQMLIQACAIYAQRCTAASSKRLRYDNSEIGRAHV